MRAKKQFISFQNNSTKKATITCSVPRRSIFGPLLFLLYVNDLHHALMVVNPIMYADNTSLFFSHSWFNAYKFLLNIRKTKYSFFHKWSNKDKIPPFKILDSCTMEIIALIIIHSSKSTLLTYILIKIMQT